MTRQQAILSTLDNKEQYRFLINPVIVQRSYQADYKDLSVLSTNMPLQVWKSSKNTIALPDVRFYSDSNSQDLTAILTRLASWTEGSPEAEPRLLKLIWGTMSLQRVRLKAFTYTVTQSRSGNPTEATGSIELIQCPEVPVLTKGQTTGILLTPREQQTLAAQVKAKTKKDVEVSQEGIVTEKTTKKRLGSLKDILGKDLKPGLGGG